MMPTKRGGGEPPESRSLPAFAMSWQEPRSRLGVQWPRGRFPIRDRSDPGSDAEEPVEPILVGKHLEPSRVGAMATAAKAASSRKPPTAVAPTVRRRGEASLGPRMKPRQMVIAMIRNGQERDRVEREHGAFVVVGVPEPGQPTGCQRRQNRAGPPVALADDQPHHHQHGSGSAPPDDRVADGEHLAGAPFNVTPELTASVLLVVERDRATLDQPAPGVRLVGVLTVQSGVEPPRLGVVVPQATAAESGTQPKRVDGFSLPHVR